MERIKSIFKRIAECFFPSSVTKRVNPRNILAFYRKEEPNNRGITLQNILEADDEWLEDNHHWVQWAFPTENPSNYNRTAPVLNRSTIKAFTEDSLTGKHMKEVFNKMLDFYGLTLEDDGTITRGPEFSSRTELWLYRNSHHFLRISRIIRSLTILLPMEEYGRSFFDIMNDIAENEGERIVSNKTRITWGL
jgi:hypothetical protein